MKKLVVVFSGLLLMGCKNQKDDNYGQPQKANAAETVSGQELFEGKGTCTACHLPDQKVIGPSLTEIAKIYKEKKGSIVSFLKEESDPIVDPGQYETMKTNFAITKKMSEEELKALEEYILTFSK